MLRKYPTPSIRETMFKVLFEIIVEVVLGKITFLNF